jgi:hypothetical protein
LFFDKLVVLVWFCAGLKWQVTDTSFEELVAG